MSSELLWKIVKKNNAYLKKQRNGAYFSTEAGNLLNKNSFTYTGLAGGKTVAVAAVPATNNKGKSVERVAITTNNNGKVSTTVIKSAKTAHRSKSRRAVQANLNKAFFRPDLASLATRRANALFKSLKANKK